MSNGNGQPLSPWIGIVLILIGLIAIVVFAYLKIPEGSLAVMIVTVGIAILHGRQSAKVQQENKVLKNSLHPPPLSEDEPKLFNRPE